jgi:hypothetical protein
MGDIRNFFSHRLEKIIANDELLAEDTILD